MTFSPEGELLMTLGTPGVAAAGRDTLDQPSDVVVAHDGTVYGPVVAFGGALLKYVTLDGTPGQR